MYDYSDVAAWGSANGFGDYNSIINMMKKDRMIPGYETPTRDLYTGMGNDYGYSDTLSAIIDGFVKEHGDVTIDV